MNNDKKNTTIKQSYVGFDLNNLFDRGAFSKKNTVKLSFLINNIEMINDTEILKIGMIDNKMIRLIKFNDEEDRPSSSFDLIDESKKQIILKTDRSFVGGLGIAEIFYELNYITQWEIPIFIKLCRAFVLGDIETIRLLVTNFNLQFSNENKWYLKDKLGIE